MPLELGSAHDALTGCARLVALALALQAAELLRVRRYLADDGVWRFALLAREHEALPWPVRRLLALLLPYRAFLGVLAAQLIGAGLMFASGGLQLAPLLLLCALLSCVRFRGTFNGGSDSMTVLILLALSVAACAPEQATLAAAGAGYIAVQVTLSYAIAGLTKLKEADWRSGRALEQLLHSNTYAVPPAIARWLASRVRQRVASWFVIAFECGFVLAWADRRVCLVLLVLGALFHLGNAALLGLNRFLFAWLAGYPAVLYFSGLSRS